MPRKAKENEELKRVVKDTTELKTKKSNTKKSTNRTTKNQELDVKLADTKTSNSRKKPVTKSVTEKKSSTSRKNTTKKDTSKKSKKSSTVKKQVKPTLVEYYDLPERYNQTVVKVLAQTPKTLFIYWEISDSDIEKYITQYGENFFETTKPVLIIHNDTLNYSFEVEINDFANSWYLHINDTKSNYRIELGRRPVNNNVDLKSDYIYITSSNKIESPNDHILFNNSEKMVYFRNVKTNHEIQKPLYTLSFMKNIGKIYDIYDLYSELYKNEDSLENLSNPSSNMSSQFK